MGYRKRRNGLKCSTTRRIINRKRRSKILLMIMLNNRITKIKSIRKIKMERTEGKDIEGDLKEETSKRGEITMIIGETEMMLAGRRVHLILIRESLFEIKERMVNESKGDVFYVSIKTTRLTQ